MDSSDHQEQSNADAHPTANANKGKNKADSSTIAERITNSGKAMLGSLVAPDHQPLSYAAQGDKATGSSGFTSRADPSRSHVLETGGSQSSASAPKENLPGETFRHTGQMGDEGSKAFDDFISGSPPTLSQPNLRIAALGHTDTKSRSIIEQEAVDGSAVFDLLSKPDEEPDWASKTYEQDYISATDATRLRAALFSNDSSHRILWDRLLNFSPNFAESLSETPSQAAHGQMGTSDVREAEKLWLQQWSEVLSSYTDEVWGDLGQLVEEARKETTEHNSTRADGNAPAEGKALARLRQILAHVRGNAA